MIIATRDFQLDYDIIVRSIQSEDIDVSAASRKFDAIDAFVSVEHEAGFNDRQILCEIVSQISFVREFV